MSLSFEEFKMCQAEVLPGVQPRDLAGKVIIVTGANVGIGYETALSLASMNPSKLILACRNDEKAARAVPAIVEATGNQAVEAWNLDLASFASVRAFASKFNVSGLPLHILVNNAGISPKAWELTGDGYEATIQINHLSTKLLTLLMPALRRSAPSRVVVVSSEVHFWAHGPTPSDATPLRSLLERPDEFVSFKRYCSSKRLNVLFVRELARRLGGGDADTADIWVCAVNPGYTISELGTKEGLSGTGGKQRTAPVRGVEPRPTREGAKTVIFCAIEPGLGPNGAYFTNLRPFEPSETVTGRLGEELGRRLWKESMEIIGGSLDERESEGLNATSVMGRRLNARREGKEGEKWEA